jgi:hypothetical protein
MTENPRPREEPLCIDIDSDLKLRLQIWCVKHRSSMKAVIGILLKRFMIEQREKAKA